MAAIPELFRHLVDDAAVFPPGLAPLKRAVPEHLMHRESWYADLIGPVLFRLREADQLSVIHHATEPLRCVAIANSEDTIAGRVLALGRELAQSTSIDVVAVEIPPLPPKGPRDFFAPVAELASALTVPVWCEVALDRNWARSLETVGRHGFHAKLRTGGLRADAFPTEDQVAEFTQACVDRSVAFKATAGLHHAIRHTAVDTGFEQHGFLNLLCAVDAARTGGDVKAALAERNPDVVIAAVRQLDAPDVRSTFHSFGCCGVTDPVDDLVALGLVSQ